MSRRSRKPAKTEPTPRDRDAILTSELIDHVAGSVCSENEFIARLEAVAELIDQRLEAARDERREHDDT